MYAPARRYGRGNGLIVCHFVVMMRLPPSIEAHGRFCSASIEVSSIELLWLR